MIIAISSILAHLRGFPAGSDVDGPSPSIVDDDESESIGNYEIAGRSVTGSSRNVRIVLFARYLGGLRVDGLEPIPNEGLNIYLAALARAQVFYPIHLKSVFN